MKCADVDLYLSEGGADARMESQPDLAAHIEGCPRCRALLAWQGAPVASPAISAQTEQQIRAIIQADLQPVRPLPSFAVVAAGACGLAVVIAGLHVLALREHGWSTQSGMQLALLNVLCLAAIVIGAYNLLFSIQPASKPAWPAWVPVAVLTLGFPGLVLALFSFQADDHFVANGIRCLAGGIMLSAMTAGASYAFARRGYSTDWGRTGALIGTISAAIAMLALQLSCPNHEVAHLLVFHGSSIALSIVCGYWLGRRPLGN